MWPLLQFPLWLADRFVRVESIHFVEGQSHNHTGDDLGVGHQNGLQKVFDMFPRGYQEDHQVFV